MSTRGRYCPYIASAMLERNDTAYFNVSGLMIYDPLFANDYLQTLPVVDFVRYWDPLFKFNSTFQKHIESQADTCGLDAFISKYLTYPPPGPFPPPEDLPGQGTFDCERLWANILDVATLRNPCFNIYHIMDTCPLRWDVLGIVGEFSNYPPGSSIYFDRADVKAAIHAPDAYWQECSWIVFPNGDASPPSSWGALPRVIDATKNVIISHGDLDYILLSNGTLLGIQNMTWGGKQGFQHKPAQPFHVPENNAYTSASLAGSGIMGTVISERGLTYVGVTGAGHMIPQFAPAAALRQLEFLLGRVDCLNCTIPFTIDE